jgi:antitoxin FitA
MNTRMASITIRKLDDGLKARLRVRAARHGHSMEEEAREILRCALAQTDQAVENLAETIRRRFAPFGGVDLPEIPRGQMREPPHFDE